MANRTALLAALGAETGSALMPLVLVYVIRDVGLPVGTAWSEIAVGTLAGLCMSPVAGRFVDRIGPRPVVIAAEVIQAVGALVYLAARDAGAGAGPGAAVLVVLVAAALLAGTAAVLQLAVRPAGRCGRRPAAGPPVHGRLDGPRGLLRAGRAGRGRAAQPGRALRPTRWRCWWTPAASWSARRCWPAGAHAAAQADGGGAGG